jgi:hypothetical protein
VSRFVIPSNDASKSIDILSLVTAIVEGLSDRGSDKKELKKQLRRPKSSN